MQKEVFFLSTVKETFDIIGDLHDTNGLFKSIINQYPTSLKPTVNNLRLRLANYYGEFEEKEDEVSFPSNSLQNFISKKLQSESGVQKHISSIDQNNVQGNIIDVAALAIILKRPIYIFYSQKCYQFQNSSFENNAIIYILATKLNNKLHFQMLKWKSKQQFKDLLQQVRDDSLNYVSNDDDDFEDDDGNDNEIILDWDEFNALENEEDIDADDYKEENFLEIEQDTDINEEDDEDYNPQFKPLKKRRRLISNDDEDDEDEEEEDEEEEEEEEEVVLKPKKTKRRKRILDDDDDDDEVDDEVTTQKIRPKTKTFLNKDDEIIDLSNDSYEPKKRQNLIVDIFADSDDDNDEDLTISNNRPPYGFMF